jgi:hypothetical protein
LVRRSLIDQPTICRDKHPEYPPGTNSPHQAGNSVFANSFACCVQLDMDA